MAIVLVGLLVVASPALAAVGAPQESEQVPAKVDPNTADAEALQRVPGIGPAMAQRIIEWRQEHGRFERIEDLLDIRGIGEKTLEKLRPYLEIRDEEDGEAG